MIKTIFLGICDNDKFCFEGVDLFKCKWKSTGGCTTVLHPHTKKPYTFSIYEIDIGNDTIIFAIGKFDDGKNAFYQIIK